MRTRELLRLVWKNIIQNKFKTILTSIGIVAGAATIVMVIAIGRGGQMDVEDQFRNLNAGAIDISCQTSQSGGQPSERDGFDRRMPGQNSSSGRMSSEGDRTSGGENKMPDGAEASNGVAMPEEGQMPFEPFAAGNAEASERVTLTKDDMEYLIDNIDGVSRGTISYTSRTGVDGGVLEEETVYTIAGVQDNYAEFSNLELAAGEFISEEDEGGKEKVCILGANTAEEIFGSAMKAYGSVLYIGQRIFVVDGVLKAMGTVASGISPDDAIFVPYATGIKYLTGETVNPNLTILAEDVDKTDEVTQEAKDLLGERYPNSSFDYSDAGSKMETAKESGRILEMLLASMAVIVFLIGGIGIMNVLFVSVKERTNEIGILKALGCSRANILLEFLLEASAISFIGGIIGSLFCLVLTPAVQRLGIRVELSLFAFAAALAFSVVTGTVFGFYPAYQASKMVPIEALNAD